MGSNTSEQSIFNPLLDELPTRYDGYAINTDYRQPLKFFAMMQDKELSDEEKGIIAILQFFPDAKPVDYVKLSEYIPAYINRGADGEESKEDPVFDLLEDSGRVYAAFLQVYHIDLTTEHLHWWIFLTLLDNLPDCTKLSEVVGIRATTIPKGTSRERASAIRRLKDVYALGKKKSIGEKLQDAWEMF